MTYREIINTYSEDLKFLDRLEVLKTQWYKILFMSVITLATFSLVPISIYVLLYQFYVVSLTWVFSIAGGVTRLIAFLVLCGSITGSIFLILKWVKFFDNLIYNTFTNEKNKYTKKWEIHMFS